MKKAGDLLKSFFDINGLTDQKNIPGFISNWKEIVGENYSGHARPSDLKGPVLIISVDHPGWMTRIQFEQEAILKRIQNRFPQLGVTCLGFALVTELPHSKKDKEEVQDSQTVREPSRDSEQTDAEIEINNRAENRQSLPPELAEALSRLRTSMRKRSK